MQELEKEKAELIARIAAKVKEEEDARTAIYWLKKQLRAVEGHIEALQPDSQVIQDISKGIK